MAPNNLFLKKFLVFQFFFFFFSSSLFQSISAQFSISTPPENFKKPEFLLHFQGIWQKQPTMMLYKKGALKNFAKFTGKHLSQSFFFNTKNKTD